MPDRPSKPKRHQTQTDRDLVGLERRLAEQRQADELERLAAAENPDGTPTTEMDDDSSRTPVTSMAMEIAERTRAQLDRPGGMAGPLRGIVITDNELVDTAIKETLRSVAKTLRNSEERARKLGKSEDIESQGAAILKLQTHMSIVRWVGITVATFTLASSIVVARMLFGWGRDDENVRLGLDRMREQSLENKSDIKELRGLIEEIRRELAGRAGRHYTPAPTQPDIDPGGSP